MDEDRVCLGVGVGVCTGGKDVIKTDWFVTSLLVSETLLYCNFNDNYYQDHQFLETVRQNLSVWSLWLHLLCGADVDHVTMSYRCRWNTWHGSECLVLAPPLLCILPDIAGTGWVQNFVHHLESLGDKLPKKERQKCIIVFIWSTVKLCKPF